MQKRRFVHPYEQKMSEDSAGVVSCIAKILIITSVFLHRFNYNNTFLYVQTTFCKRINKIMLTKTLK